MLYCLIKTARPRQWIKNIVLYASLVFSGFFFFVPADGLPYFATVTFAFVIFCILTSSVYIINDIIDVEADRKHPFKRKRPIASGALPIPIALGAAIGGIFAVVFLSLWLSVFFKLLILAYFGLQMLYAKVFKHIPIMDVGSIATGFLIRVYAGAVVVNLHMSVWFLLTVISASLFLAVAKRQSERTLLEAQGERALGGTRKILKRYSQRLLDQYTGMFATATWLTYALFAFQNEVLENELGGEERINQVYVFLPRTLQSEKLLMLTLPFVIFGVMRYLQLVYEKNEGESPDKIATSDKPLLLDVLAFGISVMVLIYVF